MAKLKGVICGVENVLIRPGEVGPQRDLLDETGRLVRFLRDRGVETVVLSKRKWTINSPNTSPRPLQEVVESAWGVKLHWHHCEEGAFPSKQSADAIKFVRNQHNWAANEVLFLGNTDSDMQSAVNGRVLLLNAHWYETRMDYGFGFDRPKEVARFIDTFCFRDHFWYFKVEDGPIRAYSLAPLSTFIDPMSYYSSDFLGNVKRELALDEEFWARLLATSLYFSGLYESINYITSYPSHARGTYRSVLINPMTIFAKCFRASYIPDLIYRHTTAVKSQTNRDRVDHLNQLRTIKLTRTPQRIILGALKPYKTCPVKSGKTVLVIDDVCTKGMSFEAARGYVERIGGSVIGVSFLKALKHDYEGLQSVTLPNGAFEANPCATAVRGKTYSWWNNVVDHQAPEQLAVRLKRYQAWDWPS